MLFDLLFHIFLRNVLLNERNETSLVYSDKRIM